MTLLITKTLTNGNEPGNSQSSVAVDPKANSKSLYLRNLAGLFARSRDQSNRASSDHPGTAITPRQKTTGQYPYRKLDSDAWEMRLLYLDGSTSKDDLLTCFIECISLIDPGVYTALSYCWGDPHITSTMRIDGYEVKITKNLESALRGVRENRSAKGGILRLWVDALCINQGDKEERSNQVRNMRQIYSKAKEVLCWVGGQEVPPLQVEGLEYLLKNQIEVQTLGTGSSSKEAELSSFGNIADEVEKEKFWTENGWALLNEFFSQPYWERVWIIQEITVASYVTVLWGNVEIPWNFVNATLMKLREAEIAKGSGSGSRIRTSSSSKAAHLLEFRDHYYVRRQPIGLLDAMRWSHKTLATDPRDKIYALLGLCHDGTQFVPIPNYRQSVNQMLLDMTRTMITLTRSLDMICLRGTRILPKGSPKTPSWVPSWTTFWSGTMTAQESRFSEWHTISDYNPILPWPDTDVLKVWGFRLGTVSGMSSAMRPYGGNESLSPNLSRSHWISSTSTLHQKDPRLDSATPEQMNFNDQIWQTLTMSLVSDKFDSATVRSCFSALWTPEERGAVHNLALIEWIDSNARFKIGEFTLREWSQLKTPGINEVSGEEWMGKSFVDKSIRTDTSIIGQRAGNFHTAEQMDAFIDVLEEVLGSGMRLALLESASLPQNPPSPYPCLVLVHPDVQVGDRIQYLRGCSIPVALQSETDNEGANSWGHRFRVIGGAYRVETEDLKVFENLREDGRYSWHRDRPRGPFVLDLI